MKSKHLVIQIDIGQGTQWGNKETINPIREIFMPSVKKYCKKFDYDYVVINKSIFVIKGNIFVVNSNLFVINGNYLQIVLYS